MIIDTKQMICCLFVLMILWIPLAEARHPIPEEHPRLLGSRDRLQNLVKERADTYQRVVQVARSQDAGAYEMIISLSLVCAIEEDEALGRQAIDLVMKYINGPIRQGHVPFATDLALCAIAYDLCHPYWTGEEREKFHLYMNNTIEANVNSEPHVFHNGWYGYKNWGIGLACYATYYENEEAAGHLENLEREFRERAAPAMQLAGDGGGWAEGYYIHYWLYEWLFFCEVAMHCEGLDYYTLAPGFFENRAIASMFESYPGLSTYNSRRPIPMGDGGGRQFGGDRDKVLSAQRILVNHFRDDPRHQAVHSFNEATPRSAVGNYAYKDFLWRDTTVASADLSDYNLSHLSPGPGYLYARSSWEDDATYFFFKCGDRFTAHQHLDLGHFLIYKHEELIGDGGHYDSFGTKHDVNYHLRSIAHNTILIHDPSEKWPGIRAGEVTGNDGGQSHSWPHHNGAVSDTEQWMRDKELYDIGDILRYEEADEYVYIAGDCSRAYSPNKLEYFTRQIVFIRPGTFVIFDRVKSKNPDFKKKFLLQAMKMPEKNGGELIVTNGEGRLFIQSILPKNPEIDLISGSELYSYGGMSYPPSRQTGPAPECRIEISPSAAAETDYFLHVLTATGADTATVPQAAIQEDEDQVSVMVNDWSIRFMKNEARLERISKLSSVE